jgi:hypothetical protein
MAGKRCQIDDLEPPGLREASARLLAQPGKALRLLMACPWIAP